LKALLIGGGGREHAIALSLVRSGVELVTISPNKNPGLMRISKRFYVREISSEGVLNIATKSKPDYVFIGPEGPIAAGISDLLVRDSFKVFAPTSNAARLETSKSFCREFLDRNGIEGNVESRVFTEIEKAKKYIMEEDSEIVIKPDGLTSGKGVVVQGTHFKGRDEAMKIAAEYLREKGSKLLIEKKMIGEEFSLQGFVWEKNIVFLPLVQDYKRALEGDKGPNTGGMGSISFSTRGLPFIRKNHEEKAMDIMRNIVRKMYDEGNPYSGPIYGQFMSTAEGVKLIEINARLGDPEAINALELMDESIFYAALEMAHDHIFRPRFKEKVNVVRYVVPAGYGGEVSPSYITINEEGLALKGLKIYFASVNSTGKRLKQSRSRTLALLSEDDNLEGANNKFRDAERYIRGKYYMRRDIGTTESIERKIAFMASLIA
jgi:phosphoribosylamine--glycine ligase